MKEFKKQTLTLAVVAAMQLLVVQTLSAQAEYFLYEDDDETIISGVTQAIQAIDNEESENAGTLTIPAQVVKVSSGAFSQIIGYYGVKNLNTLIIEDGGNPEFEISDGNNALAAIKSTLQTVEIHGNGMTLARLRQLLMGSGLSDKEIPDGEAYKLTIDIYDDAFPLEFTLASEAEDEEIQAEENTLINTNTTDVKVVLPAERVGNVSTQTFGKAQVYGRFPLAASIFTFCGNALFGEADDGSNCLFYIPTGIVEHDSKKMLHIQRVWHILPGEGVLIHNNNGSSDEVRLPRRDKDDLPDGDEQYDDDCARFNKSMLRGTTAPTTIGEKEEEAGVTYAHMILYDGAFYRTRGGTLAANRAYLRVPLADVGSLAKLSMLFDEEEEPTTTSLTLSDLTAPLSPCKGNGAEVPCAPLYDLQGRKVIDHYAPTTSGCTPAPGIYVHNGRKLRIGR